MPEARLSAPLPPGSTIGILGSGQLGRMLAMAAARLGLKTHIYCEESGPAFDVATRTTKAAFDDTAALTEFAGAVGAVTYEFENVPIATAQHLARLVPVRPSAKALEVAQDRLVEKQFISALSIPVAPFRAVGDAAELKAAVAHFGAPAILKTRRLGYDGKGQASVAARRRISKLRGRRWAQSRRCSKSASPSRARSQRWSCAASRANSPPTTARSIPTRTASCAARSCRRTWPKPTSRARAQVAQTIATALDYVGVLAVEMFHLGAGAPATERVMVNEIAPRVHNSGHWTIEACGVSQFENHMRAVAGWPLGSTERHSNAEMVNLIGEEALDWQKLAAEPGACLHLYGKHEARAGRKMGHVTRLFPK